MSRKITAYSCDFKCGHSPFTRKKNADAHEAHCIHNPVTRSCPTCRFNKFEHSEPEVGIDGGYYCTLDYLEPHQRMKKECKLWQPN